MNNITEGAMHIVNDDALDPRQHVPRIYLKLYFVTGLGSDLYVRP